MSIISKCFLVGQEKLIETSPYGLVVSSLLIGKLIGGALGFNEVATRCRELSSPEGTFFAKKFSYVGKQCLLTAGLLSAGYVFRCFFNGYSLDCIPKPSSAPAILQSNALSGMPAFAQCIALGLRYSFFSGGLQNKIYLLANGVLAGMVGVFVGGVLGPWAGQKMLERCGIQDRRVIERITYEKKRAIMYIVGVALFTLSGSYVIGLTAGCMGS